MTSPLPDRHHLPRTLVAAWRRDTASEAELQRGYARFMKHHRERRSTRPWFALVAVGSLLGVSLAAAATLQHASWSNRREAMLASPQVSPTAPRTLPLGPAPVAAPIAEAPIATATHPTDAPGVTAMLAAEAPSMTVTRAREALRSAPAHAGSLTSLPAGAFTVSPSGLVQLQWQRVADAMRASDFAGAESGLLDIERSTAGAERDAARLARAQLLVSRGDAARALELAQSLATSPSSQPTRDKARALLLRLTKDDVEHRSGASGSAAQQP